MNLIKLKLDTVKNDYKVIELMQGYTYDFEFEMTSDGNKTDLTSTLARLELFKPDKTFIIQTDNVSISNNIVKGKINANFTQFSGNGKLQLVLTKNDSIFGSWVVKCNIKENAINEADEESENIVTIIEELKNEIVEAQKVKQETERLIVEGGAVAKEEVNEINTYIKTQKNISRKEKERRGLSSINVSMFSRVNTSPNLISQDLNDSTYFTQSGISVKDKIVVEGIELTKVRSSNFYNSLSTRTKAYSGGYELELDTSKKYLCSAYCLTFGEGRFFYHSSSNTNINNAVYVDNTLRRFWFIINGDVKQIYWYVQGESGYNFVGTNYENEVYLGGFQVQEVEGEKNGIAFIGDSTVQGSAGGADNMKNSEWVKFTGALLNADFFNRGIGGNSLSQMISRWDKDITPLAEKCKYVVIQGGINDLSKEGVTSQQILEGHNKMHELAIRDGFIPVHCNITPCNKTGDIETVRQEANELLRKEYGETLLDLNTVIVDLYDDNKILQLDDWAGDGVHYGQSAKISIANYIAGRDLFELLRPGQFTKK